MSNHQTLNATHVMKLAELAKIGIDSSDVPKVVDSLNSIIAFVEHIDSLSVAHLEPMSHPFSASAHCRPDIVTEIIQRDVFQRNAPLLDNQHYLVPKVIES